MDTISQTGGNVSVGARPGRDGRDGRGIAQIEQPDNPATAVVRLTDGVGLPLALPLGPPGAKGDKGDRGSDGIRAWNTPPRPWTPSVGYSASAPADCVTINGSTYLCSVSHTSGASFDPTNWTAIALKGADSTVVGPTGPSPAYQWNGTSIRFQNPDGTWGGYVNLANNPQGTSTVSGLDDGEFDNSGYATAPATATAGAVDDGTY